MLCVDVNILVNAHRLDAPDHDRYHDWLDAARTDHERLGVPDVVASGFLRVVTHPKVFREPSPLANALKFDESLRGSPAFVALNPGERHWEIFTALCRDADARGNLVPDAFLAAIALENNATIVTADRGFARFRRVRLQHPLDPAP